jgi:hypothetical protein
MSSNYSLMRRNAPRRFRVFPPGLRQRAQFVRLLLSLLVQSSSRGYNHLLSMIGPDIAISLETSTWRRAKGLSIVRGDARLFLCLFIINHIFRLIQPRWECDNPRIIRCAKSIRSTSCRTNEKITKWLTFLWSAFPHSIWAHLMDHCNQARVPKNGRCLHNPVHRIYLQRHNLNVLKIQRIENFLTLICEIDQSNMCGNSRTSRQFTTRSLRPLWKKHRSYVFTRK